MKKTTDDIIKDFPSLFTGDPRYPSMLFGVETGEGWADIIYEACEKIHEHIKPLPEEVQKEFYFTQIKEKFGGLRIYCSWTTDGIEEIIRYASRKASKTCEVTGEVGEVRGIGGWYSCLCDRLYYKELGFEVGARVKTLSDLFQLPEGSVGTIDEDYVTGFMVKWDSNGERDGFDKKTELVDLLEVISE